MKYIHLILLIRKGLLLSSDMLLKSSVSCFSGPVAHMLEVANSQSSEQALQPTTALLRPWAARATGLFQNRRFCFLALLLLQYLWGIFKRCKERDFICWKFCPHRLMNILVVNGHDALRGKTLLHPLFPPFSRRSLFSKHNVSIEYSMHWFVQCH